MICLIIVYNYTCIFNHLRAPLHQTLDESIFPPLYVNQLLCAQKCFFYNILNLNSDWFENAYIMGTL